jgi:hypothetical protein
MKQNDGTYFSLAHFTKFSSERNEDIEMIQKQDSITRLDSIDLDSIDPDSNMCYL